MSHKRTQINWLSLDMFRKKHKTIKEKKEAIMLIFFCLNQENRWNILRELTLELQAREKTALQYREQLIKNLERRLEGEL